MTEEKVYDKKRIDNDTPFDDNLDYDPDIPF